jgi:hypothetical protein
VRARSTTTRRRPGCVTLYALCLGLLNACLALMAVIAAITRRAWADRHAVVIVLALALILFLISRGLWRLENWARLLVIVLNTLGTLGLLFSIYQALTAPASHYGSQVITAWSLCTSGVPLLLVAGITLWFTRNSKHFEPDFSTGHFKKSVTQRAQRRRRDTQRC